MTDGWTTDGRATGGVGELGGIFFQMYPTDADFTFIAVIFSGWELEINKSVFADGLIILGNLITLGKVWIKIMLAIKFGKFINFTIQSFCNFYRPFYGCFVGYRQSAWMRQTDFTDVGIWFFFVRIIFAGTKHLALGFELYVDF